LQFESEAESFFMQFWKSQVSRSLLAGILAVAASLVPAMHAFALTVDHASGKTTIEGEPKKTVVFDLASLDTMHALGVEASAVPEAKYINQLAAYAKKSVPKVGSLFEPNYEAINALSPDLIIVGGRSAPKYADLSKLAPTIDMTVNAKDLLGSVKRNTLTLAEIFNKQDKATEQLARLDQSIAALRQKAGNAGSGLIILTTGGKVSAYGPGSRFGILHDAFGIPAAAPDLSTSNHGQAVSFEFIHKTDPQWLFVIDRDGAIGREGVAASKLLDNELIRKTTAWKKKQIVYLNAMDWYLLGSAGLTAMQQNVDQLSKALDGKQ
jgi:iron complex transport system substrate-binding protein